MGSLDASDADRLQHLVERLAQVLADVDTSGLHPGSVMAEAEARLFEERDRAPMFAMSGGTRLVRYELDTQGLRWWLRGTPEGAAASRLSDEELVRIAAAGSGVRDAALEQLEEYADWVGQSVVRSAAPESEDG